MPLAAPRRTRPPRVAVLLLAASLCALPPTARALDDGLARVPPRGWRSWNFFLLDVNQDLLLRQAAALARSYPDLGPSLRDLNYTHVGLDDGWQACGAGVNGTFHDAHGDPIWNATLFPDPAAMVATARQEHDVALGWYGNNCWCAERQGHAWPWQDGGHPANDARATTQLGFRGMKIDGCGPNLNSTQWADAILAAAPDAAQNQVLIENCLDKSFWHRDLPSELGNKHVFESCPMHFFRTTSDIAPDFYAAMYNINAQERLLSPYYSNPATAPRPGCWAYPDMLEVGLMPEVDSRTHFAAWCVLSAPLVLGFDLTDEAAYRRAYPVVANPGALSVSSAWAGNSGRLLKNSSETFDHLHNVGANNHTGRDLVSFATWQIWGKPMEMSLRRWAVLLVNVAESPQTIRLAFADDVSAKLGHHPTAEDVWTGKPVHMNVRDGVATFADVAPHDSLFLFLSAPADDQQ